MSAPELASRLVRAFGKDAAVTMMSAADLKAIGRPRSEQGKLYFSPTEQRESVQKWWTVGKTGCVPVSLVLIDRTRLAPGCDLLHATRPRVCCAGSKVIRFGSACRLLELVQWLNAMMDIIFNRP
jgi:hypothetical protein